MRRLCFRNLVAGKNFPLATPAISGTIASTSSILFSINHFSVSLDINRRRFAYGFASLQGNAIDPNVADANTSRVAKSVTKSGVSELLLRRYRKPTARTAGLGRTGT